MTDLLVAQRVAPRAKFTTIYSGFEIEPFLAAGPQRDGIRGEVGVAPDELVIGTIARLTPLKGHEFLVRAAPLIVAKYPRARFLLVGDGPLRERIASQVAAAGLSDHFKFIGLVAPERIPGLIAAMDMVVHVSLREGLARVLVQSLLVGRPVISYDADGAREVAIDGETGYLLPPKSIDELVRAVARLAADSELRAQMGATGRRMFADRFRRERMVDDLHRLYERLLARPATGRPSVVAPRAAD